MLVVARLCPFCGQGLRQVKDTHWHCKQCAMDFLPKRQLRFGLGSLVRLYLTAVFSIGALWAAVLGIAVLIMPNRFLDHNLLRDTLPQIARAAIRLWPANPFDAPAPVLVLPVLAALIVFMQARSLGMRPVRRSRRFTNLSPAGWALAVLIMSYLPLGSLIIAAYVERWRLVGKYGPDVHPFRGIAGLPMPVKPALSPGPTIQTARKLLRTGQVDEALGQLKQLAEGRTANADAMSILGVAYARKRDFSQAEEALRSALDMSPESAAIHYNLSLVLHQRGKYVEASWEAQKCLDGGYPVPQSFLDRLATKVLVQDQQLVPG